MNLATIIVIALVALAFGLALGVTIKKRRQIFSCGGDCSHCAASCDKRKE